MAANGSKMRKVRATNPGQVGSVLPGPRPENAQGNGAIRLFGAAPPCDDRRGVQPEELAPELAGDGTVRAELLRLLKQPIERSVDTDLTRRMTGNEALARILLRKAINDQSQAAIDAVLDRIEGKPTKAAANKPSNGHIDEQLDLAIDALNGLTQTEEPT